MQILALLFLAGVASAAHVSQMYSLDKADVYFEEFIKTYDKHYANEAEKAKRFEIFKKNLEIINMQNSESNSSVFGITLFSDLTKKEFISRLTGFSSESLERSSDCGIQDIANLTAPDSWDWRDKGVISKPKDQLYCGSCWAFSAIGNIEAQYAIKHNKILDLSEQQLVDCDKSSSGCIGTSNVNYPFSYLVGSSGAMLEKDYPYVDQQQQCAFNAQKVAAQVTACITFQPKTEDELKAILYQTGPVTLGVDASSWQSYRRHVLRSCSFSRLNHAVLLVGYGTDNGTPYWLIKNSWGTKYGENGFIKVQRGSNACGLMNISPVQGKVK